MTMNTSSEHTLYARNLLPSGPGPVAADAALEFGRFRLLVRQRQLLANGASIALRMRGFELQLALLKADGSLVTKDQLMSRAWPGTFVAEANLKAQICALRKARIWPK